MTPKINEIIHRFQTDNVFRNKVIKSAGIAIVAIILIIFLKNLDNNKNPEIVDQNEILVDDYILADTTKIIEDKNAIYRFNDSSADGSELILGETQTIQEEKNDDIDQYVKAREKTLERMHRTPTQTSVPQRRTYNPTPPLEQEDYQNNYQSQRQIAIQNTQTPPVETIEEKERTLEDIIREKNQAKKSSKNQFKVAIHNDQTVSSTNTIVRLRLIEPIVIDGHKIGTDQFIYAKATLGNNVIDLFVENINFNNIIIPVNLWAYDYRTGNKGLTVSQENILGSAERVAENQGGQTVSRHGGQMGNALRDIFSGRNRNQKINLVNETYLFLRK